MTLATLPPNLDLPVLQQPKKQFGYKGFTSDNQPLGRRGRKPGSVDKITRDLKRGVLMGAENCGYDGAGQGGVDGFLLMCAQRYPKHYLALIGKMLPMNLNTNAPPAAMSVNIVTVESGKYIPSAEMTRIYDGETTYEEAAAKAVPFEELPPAEEPVAQVAEPQPPEEEPATELEAQLFDELARLNDLMRRAGLTTDMLDEAIRLVTAAEPARRVERPVSHLPQQVIPPARLQRPYRWP